MIEIRLEYGGMRATNAATEFGAAMATARRMLNNHGIESVKWVDTVYMAEAAGRSYAGSKARLYIVNGAGK